MAGYWVGGQLYVLTSNDLYLHSSIEQLSRNIFSAFDAAGQMNVVKWMQALEELLVSISIVSSCWLAQFVSCSQLVL